MESIYEMTARSYLYSIHATRLFGQMPEQHGRQEETHQEKDGIDEEDLSAGLVSELIAHSQVHTVFIFSPSFLKSSNV